MEHLDGLDPHVASCVVWEWDPVRRSALRAAGDEGARLRAGRAAKAAWAAEVQSSWGSCGRTLLMDGQPSGVVLYAPVAWLPGTGALPTSPVGPDAVVVSTLHVAEEHRGSGLARVLVQAAARDLVERYGGQRPGRSAPLALEAFGGTSGTSALDALAPPGCLVPTEVWLRLGFTVQRAHPRTPRLRLDLRQAVTWRGELSRALDRLTRGWQPGVVPGPGTAGSTTPRRRLSPAGRTAR